MNNQSILEGLLVIVIAILFMSAGMMAVTVHIQSFNHSNVNIIFIILGILCMLFGIYILISFIKRCHSNYINNESTNEYNNDHYVEVT